MSGLSPGPTLFPYTTLFRSREDVSRFRSRSRSRARRRGEPDDDALGGVARHRRRAAEEYGDRKSTRLNSSHLGISYAVFCLKKKSEKSRNRRRICQIHKTTR